MSASESASGRLADVMSRGEAALLSGDPERRAAWIHKGCAGGAVLDDERCDCCEINGCEVPDA